MFDNYVCKGYVVAAMKQLGKSREEIQCVLDELRWVFDIMTEQEAEQAYWDF